MDRAKAKSMTRTVQTIAVVLVAATGAAAIVPLSVKAEPVVDTAAVPPTTPKPIETPKVEVDTTTAATFLDTVSGPVKNQRVETPPTETVATPPPTGVDSWRYLGGIISSTYKRAVVVIDDQQRLLSEGQTFKDVEIVQIDKAFVKVKQGETETTINIAPRQKPVLTVLDPAVAARAGNSGVANPGAYRAPVTSGAANVAAIKNRARDLERLKTDAKMRGDEKGAELLDAEMEGLGKEGKSEKGQK